MSVDSCAEIKSAFFSGETSSGRVWRNVPKAKLGVREEERLSSLGQVLV